MLKNILPQNRPNVVVVGHITHDDYGDFILPGGSAYYTSRAYLEFGANVRLVTSVGKDFLFKEVFDGLEVFNIESEKTTTFRNHYPLNGPRIQKCHSQAKPISPVLPPLDDVDVLHLAPVISEINIKEWLTHLKAGLVVMGLQGFLRMVDKSGDVIPAKWHPEKSEAKMIDMLFLSEEDLLGHPQLLSELLNAFNLIALTKGKDGSIIYNNGKEIKIGIYDTFEVDPTGAGDIYSAVFTLARIMGTSIINSAQYAAASASIIVEGRGGTSLHKLKQTYQRQDKIPYSIISG
jgi:1D-myo-inositol 3-kinase